MKTRQLLKNNDWLKRVVLLRFVRSVGFSTCLVSALSHVSVLGCNVKQTTSTVQHWTLVKVYNAPKWPTPNTVRTQKSQQLTPLAVLLQVGYL